MNDQEDNWKLRTDNQQLRLTLSVVAHWAYSGSRTADGWHPHLEPGSTIDAILSHWLQAAPRSDKFHDCQTCRWWGNQPDPLMLDDYRECQRTASSSGNPNTPGTLAYAVDNELYGAGLITHATFGCSMWGPKERP